MPRSHLSHGHLNYSHLSHRHPRHRHPRHRHPSPGRSQHGSRSPGRGRAGEAAATGHRARAQPGWPEIARPSEAMGADPGTAGRPAIQADPAAVTGARTAPPPTQAGPHSRPRLDMRRLTPGGTGYPPAGQGTGHPPASPGTGYAGRPRDGTAGCLGHGLRASYPGNGIRAWGRATETRTRGEQPARPQRHPARAGVSHAQRRAAVTGERVAAPGTAARPGDSGSAGQRFCQRRITAPWVTVEPGRLPDGGSWRTRPGPRVPARTRSTRPGVPAGPVLAVERARAPRGERGRAARA